MKRSEAIKKIENQLNDMTDYFEGTLSVCPEDILYIAESLLGMVPPKIPTYTPSGRLWNYMHQWEPESDADFHTDKEWRNRYGDGKE